MRTQTARRRICIGVLLVLTTWILAEANQWLLRRRGEALLVDVKTFKINQTSWADTQRFMTRWGRWGHHEDGCSEDECSYTVRMDDAVLNGPEFVYDSRARRFAWMLDHLGLRASGVTATFRVSHGVLVDKGFAVEVALPASIWIAPNGTYWPSLAVGSFESTELNPLWNPMGIVEGHHKVQMIRIYLRARFTPEESTGEQAALMDFHFDCITRWVACLDRAQILPQVEKEFRRQQNSTR